MESKSSETLSRAGAINMYSGLHNSFHILLQVCYNTSHVLLQHRNGEQANLANLKMTIGSLLACSRLTGCHSF